MAAPSLDKVLEAARRMRDAAQQAGDQVRRDREARDQQVPLPPPERPR